MRNRGKPQQNGLWLAIKGVGVFVVSALLVVVAFGVMTKKIQVDKSGIRLVADTERKVTVWGKATPVDGINSDRDEYEASISPDGTEMYIVRQTRQGFADIFVSLRRNNRWTRPLPLDAINTSHDETSPRLTPDGEYLLFASERPGGLGRYDIWASKRTEDGWDTPFNLGPTVNSPHDEHSPSLTPDGRRLFFASNRNEPGEVWGGKVRQQASVNFDVFVAETTTIDVNLPVPTTRPAGLDFRTAAAVAGLNTKQYDGSCVVSPRGDYLYFTSNRAGGFGGFDIYRAPLDGDEVGKPENLAAGVNTVDNEADPTFANAGFHMYFTSDRVGSLGADDLYASELRDLIVTQRGAGALPKLGINGWLLLAAIGLFFPMLVLARSEHASLLQKGVVLSLMAHVVMVMMFSGVKVSRAVAQYVRQEMGMEIPVNLEASRLAELQLQVRNQITNMSTPLVAEVSVPRIETHERAIQPPAQVAVNVPNAAVRATETLVEPRMERRVDAPLEQMATAAPVFDPVTPDVKLPTPAPVTGNEAVARASAPQPEFERIEAKLTAGAEQISLGSVPLRPNTAVPGPVVAATSTSPPLPDAVEMGMQFNVEIRPDVILPQVPTNPVAPQQTTTEATPAFEAPRVRAAAPRPTEIARAAATTAELSVPKMSIAPQARLADPLDSSSFSSMVSAAVAADLDLAPPIAAMDIRPPSLEQTTQKVERQALVSLADVVLVPRPTDARPLPAPKRGDTLRPAESVLGVARHGSPIDIMADEAALRDATETGIDPVQAHAQVALLTGPMGPSELFTVETLAQRAQEQRQQMIEELGGNAATEDAVNRSLAWLARNQMADGRWTKFHGGRTPLRDRDNHDIALTALASLCFLGADHTPAKEGPYRDTVRRGIDFIASAQSRSGDLRGRGNMYDHAMGTIAVSEAAYMTGDARLRTVALKAAEFIVAAQREETGGWQYAPGEFGDTSVTGWCLMALHSAERVGYAIPPRTAQAASKWLDRVTAPGDSLLAGYQNRTPATPSMTAKNVFCRILLGQTLSPRAVQEASDFIASMPPGSQETDYYYWYYASISLMQLQNDGWTRWNLRLRDYLLRHQRGDGEFTGSWDADGKWTDRGGRVYCTAMATLTLEVYYRYLPMYAVRAKTAQR